MSSKNDPGNSGPHVRPIDAPDLPSWLGKPKSEVDAEDDAPTQSGAHPLPLLPDPDPAPSPHDPRELARKLAEEAKQRLATSQAARAGGPPPVPQREPQERKEETPMAAEDPRELAKRLAEEAKKRLKEPAPASRPSSHSPQHSSFPPDSSHTAGHNAGEEASVDDRPAAERAGAGNKPMSALEALAAAREAEKQRARAAQAAPPAPAPAPAERTGERMAAERQGRPEPVQRQAPPAPVSQGAPPLAQLQNAVHKVFPRAQLDPATSVTNPEVFRALWRAHSARALHEGDIQLVVTANVLQDAVGRISPGWLAAARMQLDGNSWAVWVDLERSVVLGVAQPAEIYLAGL